jgi:hypothetical protein
MPDKPLSLDAYVWKPSDEEMVLVEKMLEYVVSQADVSTHCEVIDLQTYTRKAETAKFTIAFGDMVFSQLVEDIPDDKLCRLPSLDKLLDTPNNASRRRQALQTLDRVASTLQEAAVAVETPTASHVELEDGTTAGKIGTDIQITEQEAEYLKRLKELLGGGKIVVTKGDVKIEVLS